MTYVRKPHLLMIWFSATRSSAVFILWTFIQ